jgi:MFS transporter, DHA3 family, macrolide efflux protein
MSDAVRHAPIAPDRHAGLPDWLVQNRNFVLLWAAYGVAAVGDHLSEMALLKSVNGMTRPDATRVQALISFGFFLPFVLLGPLAGWWSDRFSRKITMVVADVARAIVVWNLVWLVPMLRKWLEPHGLADFSIVIPLAIVGGLAAFFSPARQAMLPTLIRDDQLVRANALISALGTIGAILSAVLGGVLVQSVGPEWNYHINAGTFLLSAVCVGSIVMSQTRAVPHPPLEGVLTPILDGFRYVLRHRRVLHLLLLGTIFWAAAGVVISVTPAIVQSYFGENYGAAGVFRGLMGIGLAAGATVLTILGPTLPVQLAVLIALTAAGLWLAALAATHALHLGVIPTGLCLFGIGGAGAALLVTIMASMQRFVPDSRRGRVFGVNDMCTMGAMVAATGALGLPTIPNLDRFIPWLLAGVAGLFFAALAVAWRTYHGSSFIRRPDTWLTITTIKFYARFWCRAKRFGPCTIPRTGACIIVGNHSAGIDPIIMIATSPHRLPSFLVEEDHYNRPLPKYFMKMVDCIPVDRDNPGKKFFVQCLRTLGAGGLLGIFPEGTFAVPGQPPPPPKSGVGVIALRTGVPVIPVYIGGTTYTDAPFGAYFKRHHVRVRYGKPVDLSAFAARDDENAARDATEHIMRQVYALADELPKEQQ